MLKPTALFRVVGPLALCFSMMSPATSWAASDSGCWRVVNVVAGDSLNMRATPSARSAIVDRLTPNRHGIIVAKGRCTPSSKPWRSRWCPVAHHSGDYGMTSGWVKARFVSSAGCP